MFLMLYVFHQLSPYAGNFVQIKPSRSITGTLNWVVAGDSIGFERLSGGWMRNLGTLVTPESTSPLTPAYVSSNSFTSLALS